MIRKSLITWARRSRGRSLPAPGSGHGAAAAVGWPAPSIGPLSAWSCPPVPAAAPPRNAPPSPCRHQRPQSLRPAGRVALRVLLIPPSKDLDPYRSRSGALPIPTHRSVRTRTNCQARRRSSSRWTNIQAFLGGARRGCGGCSCQAGPHYHDGNSSWPTPRCSLSAIRVGRTRRVHRSGFFG